MKKLLSHQLLKFLVTSISALSILLGTNQATAQTTAFQYEGEEECRPCCLTSGAGPLLAGALVVGGVAIVAANNCRDGSDGNTGPTGSSASFSEDEGRILTFDFSSLSLDFEFNLTPAVAAPNLDPIDVILTPFVTSPDGATIQGEPVTAQLYPDGNRLVLVINDLGSIIIGDPVFGRYGPGVQILIPEASTLPVISGYTEFLLTVNVTASRDDSATTVYESDYSYDSTVPSNQYQIIADFDYSRCDSTL
jgi:hypothetical protein